MKLKKLFATLTTGTFTSIHLRGVGFRGEITESTHDSHTHQTLKLNLGFSEPLHVNIPEDILVLYHDTTQAQHTGFTFYGLDRARLQTFVASVLALKKPDAYKGFGIHHIDKPHTLKTGKTA